MGKERGGRRRGERRSELERRKWDELMKKGKGTNARTEQIKRTMRVGTKTRRTIPLGD